MNPAEEPVAPLFKGLSSGPRRSAGEVGQHQRQRLLGAMVEAVTRHGYAGVTLRELVGLAGVSKTTFYELFESKEECFLAAFDGIVEQAAAQASDAYSGGSGHRDGLLRALRRYADLIAERPDAASLVIVESLGLGTAGAAHRERGLERFEQLLRGSFGPEEPERLSELAIRGIVGGIRRVVYRRLREGHPERFGEHVEELLDWGLGYQRRGAEPVLPEAFWMAPKSVGAVLGMLGNGEDGPPDWNERPSSPRSRKTLTQRERIMRAVARLAAERGYLNLSVPSISGEAGVSNQTFYQEFAGKQEAFLAAFDALVARAQSQIAPDLWERASWIGRAGGALHAILTLIATNPLLARFAFFELLAAGPAGRDASELATERAMAFLAPTAMPEGVEPLPGVVVEAIGGGVWTIVQHEIDHERAEALPGLAPELLDFMLAPLRLGGGVRSR